MTSSRAAKTPRVGPAIARPTKPLPRLAGYRRRLPLKIGTPPWIPTGIRKGWPAPQLDDGTFPSTQRATPGCQPVAWVWHSQSRPEVEAWALLRRGLPGGFETMAVSSPPIDLNLSWYGQHAFCPPTPVDPTQPNSGPPWGDPTVGLDRREFLLFIVNNWSHVGAMTELDLLLFDWSAGAANPGALGLVGPGVYRVHEGSLTADPVAWVLHVPGFSREIWKLLDPPNRYVAPGSALPEATMWFEAVTGALPPPGIDPATWFDGWVRGTQGVGPNAALVTHDVRITAPKVVP